MCSTSRSARSRRICKWGLRAQRPYSPVSFGLTADVEDAHRLVQVDERDRPRQVTQLRTMPGVLCVQKVGCFGVASASYWLDRLAGGMERLQE